MGAGGEGREHKRCAGQTLKGELSWAVGRCHPQNPCSSESPLFHVVCDSPVNFHQMMSPLFQVLSLTLGREILSHNSTEGFLSLHFTQSCDK